MKVKIKLKICEFNELLSVATYYTKEKFYLHWSPVQKLNLRSFIFFGAKKQIDWAVNNELKNKVKTIALDVNHYEALKHVFNLETDNLTEYPKAIFWRLTEQVNKQINHKLILLKSYE